MKEIYVNKKICRRIKTSKDLSDFYAYCERDYYQYEHESDEKYLDRLPTYSFDVNEQDRIGKLVDNICYSTGDYDEENVKRILGGYYENY